MQTIKILTKQDEWKIKQIQLCCSWLWKGISVGIKLGLYYIFHHLRSLCHCMWWHHIKQAGSQFIVTMPTGTASSLWPLFVTVTMTSGLDTNKKQKDSLFELYPSLFCISSDIRKNFSPMTHTLHTKLLLFYPNHHKMYVFQSISVDLPAFSRENLAYSHYIYTP